MNRIIVYQSKTGFTKRYAKWIQEELHCELKEYKEVTKKKLASYDVIIFGSYVRMEKIRGLRQMKELMTENKKQELIFFATGSTPVTEEHYIKKIWESSIEEKALSSIPHFYMQSGLNYEKMGLVDKLLMKSFAFIMKWKNNKRKEEKKKTRDLSKSYDRSSKEYIKPLLEYIKLQ